MIFVTVGNAKQGFRRLLDAVDANTGTGLFGEESVFIQSGHNPDFKPRQCEYELFLSMDEFQQWMEDADLIICHGGCTQISAIRLGKTPIVMPRRKKYGEHINDHQMQLVQALAAEGRIIPAYEPEDLPGAIEEAKRIRELGVRGLGITGKNRMVALVGKAIEEIMKR